MQNSVFFYGVDSWTLAEMPKVQMKLDYTSFIRGEVKAFKQSVMPCVVKAIDDDIVLDRCGTA